MERCVRRRVSPELTVPWAEAGRSSIDSLDDSCLLRIFARLTPMPDRFNAGRVCRRWQALANDQRMWLSVEHCSSVPSYPVFGTLEAAVAAARPGDTIIISAGQPHDVSNVRIEKPLRLIGNGKSADRSVLSSPRGCDSALEFHANAHLVNLSIKSELGSCILHKKGRLIIEACALECIEHPLEHLSCPIVTVREESIRRLGSRKDAIVVVETRIEGGEKAVKTSEGLMLQHVRAIWGSASVFWFSVVAKCVGGNPPASAAGGPTECLA
ncbi:hypothetical protein CBR_g30624 [Chara braunii]|uniref:F-box domain-containing protein n=1 Tax=Chara braunii TaxID=69332 RepID=A0A388LD83_CHABU|nr:hypothetical protein CBR_g30624 [Chara braunii]|eukprot:GBG80258.1 hypothetical protein CBR_g30624 [Chara braunii]